jgi:hypothetical protein
MVAKSNDNVNRLDATSFLRGGGGEIASGFVFDPKQAIVYEAMAGVGDEKMRRLKPIDTECISLMSFARISFWKQTKSPTSSNSTVQTSENCGDRRIV